MSTHAEQQAAMTAWLDEHARPWHGTDARMEARIAHVSDGGTLRPVPTAHTMRPRFRKSVPDELGWVSDDGVHVSRWEPTSGDAA